MRTGLRPRLLVCFFCALLLGLVASLSFQIDARADSPDIVISQVYGGGNTGGATYDYDYVVLFNRGSAPASLNGWMLHYAAHDATFWSVRVALPQDVVLQPGQSYLIQFGNPPGGDPLPATPDLIGGVTDIAHDNIKFVLTRINTQLDGAANPNGFPYVADGAGFGTATGYELQAAPALSSTTAGLRKNGGCTDTDNNNSDFLVGAPLPLNSSTPATPCNLPPDKIVTNCATDAELRSKLTQIQNEFGGTLAFECGPSPVEIVVSNVLPPISWPTHIYGNDLVTISGNNTTKIIRVNANASLTLRGMRLIEGNAGVTQSGGTIESGGNLLIDSSTIESGEATHNGGAITVFGGALSIVNSTLRGNSARWGGAIEAHNAMLYIENSVFRENVGVGDSEGGALFLWNSAQIKIVNSLFEDNSASRGGAIKANATTSMDVHKSAFLNNSASVSGGVLYNEATAHLTNVTLDGNSAEIGGAILNKEGASTALWFATVTGNTSGTGHGALALQGFSGGINLFGSIVALNIPAGINCHNEEGNGQFSVDGYNVLSDGSCGVGATDFIGDPLLSPLVDVGITEARFLLEGSPAQDRVLITDNTIDQRGVARPAGSAADAGAVEMRETMITVTRVGQGTVIASGIGIDCGDTCSATAREGTEVTLIATPDIGHAFTGWSGACTGTGNCLLTLVGDVTVTATFAPLGGATNTPTNTPIGVPTNTPTNTPTGTLIGTPTNTPTNTPTGTLVDTPTQTPVVVPDGPTPTPTHTPTGTLTPTPSPTPFVPGPSDPTATLMAPAPIPGGVAATIALNRTQGYGGQSVVVSGQIPQGYSQARVLVMAGGQTLSSAVATAQNGAYSSTYTLPVPISPQTLRLCAIVVGAINAQMKCADLQVVNAPTGQVTGSLAGESTTASVALLNRAGEVAYITPLERNGSFSFTSVAPGLYQYAPYGGVDKPYSSGTVQVASGVQTVLQSVAINCGLLNNIVEAGYMTASPTGVLPARAQVEVSYAELRSGVLPRTFGWFGNYIEGVTGTNVTFTAQPQSTNPPQVVSFRFYGPDGTLVQEIRDTAAPWSVVFDVGRLPASRGTSHSRVVAVPIVDGQVQCTAAMGDIVILPNILKLPGMRPNPITWNAIRQRYDVKAVMPYIPGVLPPPPFELPPEPLPEIEWYGRFQNGADAGIAAVGYIQLDGSIRLWRINAFLWAKLLDTDLIGPTEWGLFNFELQGNINDPLGNVWQTIREYEVPFPSDVNDYFPGIYVPTPFLSVPVASFFGLIDITVHGQAGYGASFSLTGYIKPLKPEVSATFTASARADAELGVGLRLVQGLADFGATARVDGNIDVPITVKLSAVPEAHLKGCLALAFKVRAWAEVLWGVIPGTRYDETETLASWDDCIDIFAAGSEAQQAAAVEAAVKAADETPDPTIPSNISAPQIAAAPDGRMLRAWSENMAPAGQTPQIRILASLKPAGSTTWGAATPVSSAIHSSRSPVVGFAGPGSVPVVAWVENTMTAAQAAAAGENLSAHLNKQEIVYALYSGGAWASPIQLTTDSIADGLPALGAGAGGAVLAWVRDIDGNPVTRADQKIAASLFNPGANTFSPFSVLSVAPGGFSADVAASWASTPVSRPWLTWIFDADSDLVSADDRRIAVAFWDGATWQVDIPDSLPARVDSPAIAATADGVRLAFLVREAGLDGKVPLLGANGILWTARFANNVWTSAAAGTPGSPVYAEQPELAVNGAETLLLFRRIGRTLDFSSLGQLALIQINGAGSPGAPLYVTNEPRQNWYGWIAIDPTDGQAEIIKQSRPLPAGEVTASELTTISESEVVMVVESEVAAANVSADPIEGAVVDDTPNLALEPLVASNLSPDANTPVQITLRVRNAGRLPAGGATLALYAGDPATSAPVATLNVAAGLTMGGLQTLQATFPAPGSQFVLTARLAPAGGNASTADDVRTLAFGVLTAPAMQFVSESGVYLNALAVQWSTPAVEDPDGFRVYRAPAEDGPWELIGETSESAFHDINVARGSTLCYKTQSFHATGGLSPMSATAVCGVLPNHHIFLPAIER